MKTHAAIQANQTQPLAQAAKAPAPTETSGAEFVDPRPEAERLQALSRMANDSPQVRQLRALQAMVDTSPRMRSQLELRARLSGPAAQRRQGETPAQREAVPTSNIPAPQSNRTGLPDSLKAGVEALSGFSMDDVRVHYGSDKPAQLNALAYTQGTDIHVGPGQEQHLAHEAWHVVQQKQGRVKPTFQMKEVAINDEEVLEREADVMGNRAMSDKPYVSQDLSTTGMRDANKLGSNGVSVYQRKLYPFQDKTGKSDMTTMAGWLNEDVDKAKSIVDASPLLKGIKGRDDGYLGAWVKTFAEFSRTGQTPDFFYARYGYAIETLAQSFFLPRKLGKYETTAQVTYGATRPDFVIQLDNQDVAWLDITSEGSPGHIYNKQGGGWKIKPYVAEVRYDMPSPTDFAKTAKDELTPEQKEILEKASIEKAKADAALAKGRDTMATIIGNALEEKYNLKGDGLSKSDVKTTVKEVCNTYLKALNKDKELSLPDSIGVLSNLETIIIGKDLDTGLNWANWAYGGVGNARVGRELLKKLGGANSEDDVSGKDLDMENNEDLQ